MELILSDSTIINIEHESASSAFDTQAVDFKKASAYFSDSMKTASILLKDTIEGLTDNLREKLPDSLEVTVGLKIGAEGNIILSKGSAEANLTFKATWNRRSDE